MTNTLQERGWMRETCVSDETSPKTVYKEENNWWRKMK